MPIHAQKLQVANRRIATALFAAFLIGSAGLLAGCGGTSLAKVTKHGHQFRATDAQLVQPGMSQEDVRLSLGTPTTTSRTSTGEAFYYISSTTRQMAFLDPKEIDRRVFAVYFTELGTVDRIANYGLKDGRVFDFINRTTPAAGGSDEGFLSQMFKNLGRRGSVFGQ
ncbi:MAG: outer membrane protein assembly factor BamE [Pseudomonadota bacterium]